MAVQNTPVKCPHTIRLQTIVHFDLRTFLHHVTKRNDSSCAVRFVWQDAANILLARVGVYKAPGVRFFASP
eukprot:COSAG01_NODE_7427_length_3213_cov_10.489724_4_plen_71_part_00